MAIGQDKSGLRAAAEKYLRTSLPGYDTVAGVPDAVSGGHYDDKQSAQPRTAGRSEPHAPLSVSTPAASPVNASGRVPFSLGGKATGSTPGSLPIKFEGQ